MAVVNSTCRLWNSLALALRGENPGPDGPLFLARLSASLPCHGPERNGLYLLMLRPSDCVCSCTWLRADDGLVSCAEDTDSRLGSIADQIGRASCRERV